LVKENRRVKKARLYVRGAPGPPLTVFDFSTDRSKQRPLKFLDGYQDYVYADAYNDPGTDGPSAGKFDSSVIVHPPPLPAQVTERISGFGSRGYLTPFQA